MPNPQRWAHNVLAVVAVVTACGLLYLFFELVSSDAKRHREYRTNLVWNASQIERNGLLYGDYLGRYLRGEREVAAADVMEQLQIFFSWLNSARSGPLGDVLQHLDPAQTLLDEAHHFVDEQKNWLQPALEAGRGSGSSRRTGADTDAASADAATRADVDADAMLTRLRGILTGLHQLVLAADRVERNENQRRRSWSVAFYSKAVPLFGAVIVSGGLLLSLSLSGQRKLSALKESLEANVQARTRELTRLRNRLSDTINSMPSMLIGVNRDGLVNQWNLQAQKVTGLSEAEAMDRPLVALFPGLGNELVRVKQAIASGQPQRPERIRQHGVGDPRHIEITVYPLTGDDEQGAVIRLDDITERVRIEEMMIQSEKMLSVGLLATGMSHEINNPLAGIVQNAQVMRNRLIDDSPQNRAEAERCGVELPAVRRYLERRQILTMVDTIIDSGLRAASIVSNMLNFSRKSDSQHRPCDLGELLDRTLELAGNDYRAGGRFDFRRIRVERHYPHDLPQAPCAPGEIQQVFLNLIKNCAQALADYSTVCEPGWKPALRLSLSATAGALRVEIADNGPGVSDAVRKRMFEPFFTTKDVGKGTGLGLSISYFIINENHGGTLSVESEPGHGTCFIVQLPLARAIAA